MVLRFFIKLAQAMVLLSASSAESTQFQKTATAALGETLVASRQTLRIKIEPEKSLPVGFQKALLLPYYLENQNARKIALRKKKTKPI